MNFDTKHLVRWGIPGWMLIITAMPYIFFTSETIRNGIANSNLVAIGTFLTVSGVPIGYLLNQIHHAITWVIPQHFKSGKWDGYFTEEINVDKKFLDDNGEKKKERYRYLLSKKHEVGGVLFSFLSSVLIISFTMITNHNYSLWSLTYIIIVILLSLLMLAVRNYTSKNVQRYFEHYKNE